MRKLGILPMLTSLLLSCSIPGINAAPTNPPPQNTPVTVDVGTPTQTATITPTLPTPTYTSTPTLQRAASTAIPESSPSSTFTPLPLFPDTPTPLILFTADTPGEGFKSVEISGNQIFWGICKPGTVKFTVEVVDPEEVYNVVLFIQLMDVDRPDHTPWSKGAAMNDHRDGTFSYTLNADTVDGRNHYLKAWVLYQLVATDRPGNIIGRTKIYSQALTIEPCR
jgi:hypothetical protein